MHNEFIVQYTLYLKSITTIWFINIYNADAARSLQTEHKRNRKKLQEQKKDFCVVKNECKASIVWESIKCWFIFYSNMRIYLVDEMQDDFIAIILWKITSICIFQRVSQEMKFNTLCMFFFLLGITICCVFYVCMVKLHWIYYILF